MFYHQDWLMRQIELLIQAIINTLLNKNPASSLEADASTLQMRQRLSALLREKRICEAENLIFEQAEEEKDDPSYFALVLDFYKQLNDLSEAELNAHDFSHEEIKEGLISFFSDYCTDEEVYQLLLALGRET